MRKKRNYSKKKSKEKFFAIFFICFLAFCIMKGIELYRKTFVDWYVLLLPILIGPLLIIRKATFFTGEAKFAGAIVMTYIYFAPAFFYLFLATNFYIGNNTTTTQHFKIIKKGEAHGGRTRQSTPYAVILFDGKRKQLYFTQNERKQMYKSNNVELEYHKGILQFFVLDSYSLKS